MALEASGLWRKNWPLESGHAAPDGGTTFLLYACSIWLTSLSAVDRGGAHSSIFICARRAHAIFLDDLHDNLRSPARGLSQGTVLAYSVASNLGANNASRENSAITMKTVTSARESDPGPGPGRSKLFQRLPKLVNVFRLSSVMFLMYFNLLILYESERCN